MKNIVFFRNSLVLVGLLCSDGQANYASPISDEVNNIPNFAAAIDAFDSQPLQQMLFDLYAEIFKSMSKLINSLGSVAELNTDIVKRTAINANTDRTKFPEDIDVSIKYNNVTEIHTQPNIYYSTPINDRLINNNTKQNNDTYVKKFYNSSCILSSCEKYLIKINDFSEQYNKIVKKLHTVFLLPRSFIASIVPGIRKYWLLRGISADSITGDVVLYMSLVVSFGMLLFLPFITIKAILRLWNSRRKLKKQKEHLLYYVV